MTDVYFRPRKFLGRFSRLYPDAWKHADEFDYRFDRTSFDAISEGSVYA